MEIKVRIADSNTDDRTRARNSLLNWLNSDRYIRENARPTLPDSRPENMGAELEVIQMVLSNGFKLAELALEIARWVKEMGKAAVPVVVDCNGQTTELSLSDMNDPTDESLAIRRALVGAPDPRNSSCVLVGVSDYANLRELPRVCNNLEALREVFLDPGIWGIPEERLWIVNYPRCADTILKAIREAIEDGPETLFVYFAGHGLLDQQNKLLLALPDATGNDEDQTVAWDELAEVIRQANCRRRVVWLDCCYAGRALPDDEADRDDRSAPELLRAAQVEGTYLLAATHKYAEANSPDGEGMTAFTGELVNVLRSGIRPGPPTEEFLSLNSLHQEVRSALRDTHLPEPKRHDPGHIGQLPHFHNNATRPPAPPEPVPEPRTFPLPVHFGQLRGRSIVVAGLVILVALAVTVFVVVSRSEGSSGPPLSGLSLTKYCSALGPQGAQGFTVAGTDCVHRINLDEACTYQYREPNLKAIFTTNDPDSAICVNSANGDRYDAGISDMTGYCKTLTTVADVTATAAHPGYENTWVCDLPINMELACDAQNNQNSLTARQVNGAWMCYDD